MTETARAWADPVAWGSMAGIAFRTPANSGSAALYGGGGSAGHWACPDLPANFGGAPTPPMSMGRRWRSGFRALPPHLLVMDRPTIALQV